MNALKIHGSLLGPFLCSHYGSKFENQINLLLLIVQIALSHTHMQARTHALLPQTRSRVHAYTCTHVLTHVPKHFRNNIHKVRIFGKKQVYGIEFKLHF